MTRRIVLLWVCLPFLAWCGPAGAQTAELPVAVPEVNVSSRPVAADGPVPGYVAPRAITGSKTDTPLVENPQSVSVVTRDLIDNLQAQTVVESVRFNAGVSVGNFGFDPRFDQIYLRGFAVNTLGDYRDGLRQGNAPFTYFRTEPYGLERITLLRGPASVLYGQSGPGGLIDRVSKLPTEGRIGEVRLTTGSYDRLQGAFDVGGAVDEGSRVLFRVTGLARNARTDLDWVPDDRLFLQPAVTFRNDSTTLTILGHVQQDRTTPSAAYYSANGRPTRIRTSDRSIDGLFQSQQQVGYRFEHRFDEAFSVRQNLRYGHATLDAAYLTSNGLRADGRTLNRNVLSQEDELDSFVVDSMAEARFATGPLSHTVLLGVDYQNTGYDTRSGTSTGPTLDLGNLVYGEPIALPRLTARTVQQQDQVGIYAQDQIRLGRLVVTGGLRHDWADQSSASRATGVRTLQDDSALTGRVGAVYLFEGGLTPYANYATSFNPQVGVDRLGSPFEPIRGEQVEGGLRYQPPGTNSILTASAFQITQRNSLTPDPEAPTRFSVQTGETRSRGVELEAVASLADGLNLIASYTWQDVEVTRSNSGNTGKRPVGIPEHLAGLWLDYSIKDGPLAGLGLGGGVRYFGETPANALNTLTNKSYLVLDAAIRYDVTERLQLALNGYNLTDTDQIQCQSGACYQGLPMTWLASARFRF
ncbi:TonB-dependent siderophore receptor [Pararoseomonas sp. SCSIO 73927]|uniref:TonB-dependent siderophore receptor n=1 Tax=Pararoseomonas sp. SCSIO 73927 TaxID=3114537 RepID=UPI0030CE7D85